jgi:hypothetical protein
MEVAVAEAARDAEDAGRCRAACNTPTSAQ